MKRYKVVIKTQFGIKTAMFEARDQDEAERKAIAALPSWHQGEKKTVTVTEVGPELRRVMP